MRSETPRLESIEEVSKHEKIYSELSRAIDNTVKLIY